MGSYRCRNKTKQSCNNHSSLWSPSININKRLHLCIFKPYSSSNYNLPSSGYSLHNSTYNYTTREFNSTKREPYFHKPTKTSSWPTNIAQRSVTIPSKLTIQSTKAHSSKQTLPCHMQHGRRGTFTLKVASCRNAQ